jgi:hypothetical protein
MRRCGRALGVCDAALSALEALHVAAAPAVATCDCSSHHTSSTVHSCACLMLHACTAGLKVRPLACVHPKVQPAVCEASRRGTGATREECLMYECDVMLAMAAAAVLYGASLRQRRRQGC